MANKTDKPVRAGLLAAGIALITAGATLISSGNFTQGAGAVLVGLVVIYSYELLYDDLLERVGNIV